MFPSVTISPNFRTWLTVPKKAAGVRNYNGSSCRVGGAILHCWRSEDAVGKSTLWLGQVDAKGKLSKCRELITDPAFDAEDPRLFVVGDSLRLMWSKVRDTRHASGSWNVVQMLSYIHPLTLDVISSAEIELPGIKSRFVEKNWTPLPDGGWLYDIAAGISITGDGRKLRNRPFHYPWGSFSGSSPAIPWPERKSWLMIYHGFQPHPQRHKRYYFGAAEIDPATHRVLRLSRTPLVFSSEEDPTIVCPRCAEYNPSVVFPAGLVRDGARWIVSGGVHDSRDAWWSYSDDDLVLVPQREALDTKRLLILPGAVPPSGYVFVRVVSPRPIFESGTTWLPGDVFQTLPSRADALCKFVERLS